MQIVPTIKKPKAKGAKALSGSGTTISTRSSTGISSASSVVSSSASVVSEASNNNIGHTGHTHPNQAKRLATLKFLRKNKTQAAIAVGAALSLSSISGGVTAASVASVGAHSHNPSHPSHSSYSSHPHHSSRLHSSQRRRSSLGSAISLESFDDLNTDEPKSHKARRRTSLDCTRSLAANEFNLSDHDDHDDHDDDQFQGFEQTLDVIETFSDDDGDNFVGNFIEGSVSGSVSEFNYVSDHSDNSANSDNGGNRPGNHARNKKLSKWAGKLRGGHKANPAKAAFVSSNASTTSSKSGGIGKFKKLPGYRQSRKNSGASSVASFSSLTHPGTSGIPGIPGIHSIRPSSSTNSLTRLSMKRATFNTVKRSFARKHSYSDKLPMSSAESLARRRSSESLSAMADMMAISEDGKGLTGDSAQDKTKSKHFDPKSPPPMHTFYQSLDHSWISHLSPETPDNYHLSTTKYAKMSIGRGGESHPGRPIFNGHYVRVRPTPLKNPKMVVYSDELLREMGFREEEVNSDAFVRYFSGDVDGAMKDIVGKVGKGSLIETWATPYALSIMGRRYTSNCPYGTGDGYGDGRAISVGEIVVPFVSGLTEEGGDGTTLSKSTSISVADTPSPSNDNIETNIPLVTSKSAISTDATNSTDPNDLDTATSNSSLYPFSAHRYELQLKGAGQTPFCRGADGRAVLRSSIREFLASEAMYHLGVCTTRALSLIVSDGIQGDTSTRPWYSDGARSRVPNIPSMDDERLAGYNEKERREIISQLAVQAKADPDTLVEEKCAITTRVASSFVRVGHFDLFARRVELWKLKMAKKKDDMDEKLKKKGSWGSGNGKKAKEKLEIEKRELDEALAMPITETREYKELEQLLWHACYREYYREAYWPYWEAKDAKAAAIALMDAAMVRIANTVAGWVRVGFVQGNFNADNCLVGGRTMDYGPFGFIDVYHPLAAKWTGSGDHFGFMNQPSAGYANFAVLVESLLPIIEAHGGNTDEVRDEMLKKASSIFSDTVDKIIREKMGLEVGPPDIAKEADELWEEIEPLMRTARADWTLFWRQLTYVAEKYPPSYFLSCHDSSEMDLDEGPPDYDSMLKFFLGDEVANPGSSPFYDELTDDNRETLRKWIERWHKALTKCHNDVVDKSPEISIPPPQERMRMANPKYTLREWMLVEAYTKADAGKYIPGDYSSIKELLQLSKTPYGEGSPEHHKKYYRRAPDVSLRAGGQAFMS